jgi:uncharacterized protein (TIGR02284 family)
MPLSNEKQIEELNDLIRLDHAAVGVYSEAVDALESTAPLRDPLSRFRGDHERHIVELSQAVRRLGGKPADHSDTLIGGARKLMTKIAGLIGAETVLKAMKSNEEAINHAYLKRVSMEFPADTLELIQRNYGDEKRHLEWVEQALRTRLWESATAHP